MNWIIQRVKEIYREHSLDELGLLVNELEVEV